MGTKTICFIPCKSIPKDRKFKYLRIVVDIREHKEVKERFHITVGGDKVEYPGKVTARMADTNTVKIHINSTISTQNARFVNLDIGNFYLETPMERKEYAKIRVDYNPKQFMNEYDLWSLVEDGYIYIEISKGMYGLPQAGILANELLRTQLQLSGFYE